MQQNKNTKRLVYTALLIALTVALRYALSIMLPFAGAGGMRISPSIFFTKMPAVIFGPLYGAVSSGLIDIICLIVKPEGSFIPFLTVTAVLGGFLCGFLWKKIDKMNGSNFKTVFGIIFSITGIIGIVNSIFITFYQDSAYTVLMYSMGEKRFWFITVGLICASVLGFIVLITNFFVSKKNSDNMFIKLLTVLFITNIIVTTINTFVLRIYIPALNNIAFFVFYIPRLIEEIIATILQSYVMVYFLRILKKINLINI